MAFGEGPLWGSGEHSLPWENPDLNLGWKPGFLQPTAEGDRAEVPNFGPLPGYNPRTAGPGVDADMRNRFAQVASGDNMIQQGGFDDWANSVYNNQMQTQGPYYQKMMEDYLAPYGDQIQSLMSNIRDPNWVDESN